MKEVEPNINRNRVDLHKERNNNFNTVIFSDSMPKGIKMYEFNKHLTNGRALMKSFGGATSRELACYIMPTLEDYEFVNAIIHVGIIDILKDSSAISFEFLANNIKKMVHSCRRHGILNISISGLVECEKADIMKMMELNSMLKNICNVNNLSFIDNTNIANFHLSRRDGIHLIESGKRILANNFIKNINSFLPKRLRTFRP